MLLDIIKAIVYAGLPVAVISYYLIRFTSKKTVIKATNAKELKKELKNVEYKKDPESHIVQQMLHKKYLRFGGGFYGVLSFITYFHIETYQIIDFVRNFKNFQHFIDSVGFSMVVNFFIEAIMNLISAFIWPLYWYKYMPIGSFWVWLIVAIVAHSMATKLALSKNQ